MVRGEAITRLAWLCPSAGSLLALARSSPTQAWSIMKNDPGSVLLVVRHGLDACANSQLISYPSALHHESIFQAAVLGLADSTGDCADWQSAALHVVLSSCGQYARCASRIAQVSGRTSEELAWVAGLLTPLGWIAAAASQPDQVAACLEIPDWPRRAAEIQEQFWGADLASIARRLNRRWQIPDWLAAVTGNLALPGEIAQQLGADLALFQVVQLAALLCQEHGEGLALAVGDQVTNLAESLGLSLTDLAQIRDEIALSADCANELDQGESPYAIPLLPDLLKLAAENRRLAQEPALRRLEAELDTFQHAFERVKAGEADRLQSQKLTALAEFAAGAGHEINNPLAVISGQAQYLLSHEADPERQRALQTIVNQAQRIHHLLVEVMHFARPPLPNKQAIDLAGLMREAVQSLHELAHERRVEIKYLDPASLLPIEADPNQVRTALTCLLRNAIEAAPTDGWAAVRLEITGPDLIEIIVEDSGPGLLPGQSEHLFDPFYSGRQAGRGRGLGLPTAWRLANVQGGNIRYAGQPEGPTRFVLRLPRQPHLNGNHTNGVNGH